MNLINFYLTCFFQSQNHTEFFPFLGEGTSGLSLPFLALLSFFSFQKYSALCTKWDIYSSFPGKLDFYLRQATGLVTQPWPTPLVQAIEVLTPL